MTKVAPIKRLTISRLECGALILTRMIHHIAKVLEIGTDELYSWMDSTIVLGWLLRNSNRFKSFVSHCQWEIADKISPSLWNHVSGIDNRADPASPGIYPGELVVNDLWWQVLSWLRKTKQHLPSVLELPDVPTPSE